MRQRLVALLSSRRWEQAIIAVIVINSIILGLETEPGIMAAYGPMLQALDAVILGIFVVEITLRILPLDRVFSAIPGACSILQWWPLRWSPLPGRSRCCAPCVYCASCG